MPKLVEGPSSAVEPEYPAIAEAKGESAEVPKPMVIAEQEKTAMAEVPKRTAKAGPSAPIKAYALEATPLTLEEESAPKKAKSPAPEVLAEELDFIV